MDGQGRQMEKMEKQLDGENSGQKNRFIDGYKN